MNNPISIIPAPQRARRRRKHLTESNPPVVGPTLVASTWSKGDLWVQLQFDEPIDPSGVDGSQIIVDSFDNGRYQATKGISIVNANTVRLGLDRLGEATQDESILSASDTNGIISSEDLEMWSGVTDVELPFP